jgi:hypothetical protein
MQSLTRPSLVIMCGSLNRVRGGEMCTLGTSLTDDGRLKAQIYRLVRLS